MQKAYWLKSWAEDRTGFHQKRTNTRLIKYWPQLGVPQGAEVFVPLAGKSLDMLWLLEQGHRVFGVELSVKAVEAFFTENDLPYSRHDTALGPEYRGAGAAAGLRLLAGDFFALAPRDLADVAAFYDRASLIAMNADLRADYARQLGALMPAGAVGLLLTIDYDPEAMTGPPFPVPDALSRQLLEGDFAVEEWECHRGDERLGNLKARGLDTLTEYVYRLHRLP